jgi:hypothetical protein
MFGFNPSTFSDPFDVNKVAGTNSREQAKLKSQAFLTDSNLGGAATGIFAKNKAEDIMAKANASAQSTANNAAGISGIFNAVGSIGSFGAAGGFGKVTDFSQPVFGSPGARETIGGYGGNEFFKPSEIPGFDTSTITVTPRDMTKHPLK